MEMTTQPKLPFGTLRGPHLFIVYVMGLVSVYAGERIIGGSEGLRFWVTAAGSVLILLSTVLWGVVWGRVKGPARQVERLAALLSLGGVVALVLYALGSDLLLGPAPTSPPEGGGITMRQLMQVAWPIVLLSTLLPLLFVQISAASMAKGQGVEPFRAAASARSGATTAALLASLFLLNAVANRKDVSADLSYFKTAMPSEQLKDLIAAADEKTEAILFFPKVSEVKAAVEPFFKALEGVSNAFKITYVDPALRPELAREHRVTQDGTIVLVRGESSEKLQLGDTMKTAKRKIASMDSNLQRSLLKLTVERKTVYLITGHGERAEKASEADTRPPVGTLSKLLENSNLTIKKLGPVEGLASGVPEDAAVVIWIDPTVPPFPGEIAALKSCLEAGGRMLLTLEPSSDPELKELLDFIGVSYTGRVLANDKAYVPLTRTEADKHNLVTASFSSHPSVGSFSNRQTLVPVLFPTAGSLAKAAGTQHRVTFTVRAPAGTWMDLEPDSIKGDGEAVGTHQLAAAITAKVAKPKGDDKAPLSDEMRAVVFADTDLFSDEYIGFRLGRTARPGNLQLLADALEWLVDRGKSVAVSESDTDIRVAHTRDEDVFWFYLTIFAVPLLILGIGVATRWGRGRRHRRTT